MRNLIPYFIHEQFKKGNRSGRFRAISLFVDLSGFTTLTEALMQYEKDGAEVLNDALESIFAPLVSEVVARGGIIPLYAGDAFAALFPHEPDEPPDMILHALKTAGCIQDLFDSPDGERVLETKYGSFTLAAKAGLSYGDVSWGIPGQDGRHLFFFRGPAMQQCVRAEQFADKGQIIVDEFLFPWVKQYVPLHPATVSGYYQMPSCQLDFAVAQDSSFALTDQDLSPFVPIILLDLPAKAEFRTICPVFLSFKAPANEADLFDFLMDAFELCYSYGGKLSQVDFSQHGALLVIWFGAPVAYENNAERSAEFLLALRRKGWSVEWRAGVTQGVVWAGFRGAASRCEYAAIGDVVNMACRLATDTHWGEIWVDEAVRNSLGDQYRLNPKGTLHFKGKRHGVPVFQLERRNETVGAGMHQGKMVGRQKELARLDTFVEPIFQNRFAGLLTVYGDAGMGKSRLVFELRRRLSRTLAAGHSKSAAVRWFLCPTDGILCQSLFPFKHLLRRYFRQSAAFTFEKNRANFERTLEGLLSELNTLDSTFPVSPLELAAELQRTRSFLAALVDLRWDNSLYEQLEPQLRFENTLRAFKNLLRAESLRRPVVLQLEDLHWIDQDSREMVKVLTHNMQPFPIAVICTSRYRDDGGLVNLGLDNGVVQQVVELDYLGSRDARALAGRLLNGQIEERLAAFLAEKTAGNPFFVEQLVLDLRERDLLDQVEGGAWTLSQLAEAEVPSTINAVLIARLDRLVAQVRQVVQAAAVLGREFHIDILARVLQGDAEIELRVKQAEVQRIWRAVDDLRYIFRHALMRDAAYEMQLRSRLRELHKLAAAAIEQEYAADLSPHYLDLVYHTHHAGDLERERLYAKLAAEEAVQQFANEEAVSLLQRALDLTPEHDLVEQYSLLRTREHVFNLMGDREAQARDIRALQKLAVSIGTPQLEAEATLLLSSYADVTADYQASMTAACQAVDQSRVAGDKYREAAAFRQWGEVLWHLGDFQVAQEKLEHALTLAQTRGMRQIEADCLQSLAPVAYLQGDYQLCIKYKEQALVLYRQLGNRRGEAEALNGIGHAMCVQGFVTQALQHYQNALEIHREIGDRQGEGLGYSHLASVRIMQGMPREAKAFYLQSLAIHREVGDRRGEGMVLDSLSHVSHQLGEYELARDYAIESTNIAQDMGVRYLEGYALTKLGRALASLGLLDQASDAYHKALDIRREASNRGWMVDPLTGLTETALQRGDLAQALEYADQVVDFLELIPMIGVEEPFWVYATCYQVLAACNDPRGRKVLDSAYQFLQERSAQITDEQKRRAFFENIPSARKILLFWQKLQDVGEL